MQIAPLIVGMLLDSYLRERTVKAQHKISPEKLLRRVSSQMCGSFIIAFISILWRL